MPAFADIDIGIKATVKMAPLPEWRPPHPPKLFASMLDGLPLIENPAEYKPSNDEIQRLWTTLIDKSWESPEDFYVHQNAWRLIAAVWGVDIDTTGLVARVTRSEDSLHTRLEALDPESPDKIVAGLQEMEEELR